MEGHMAKDCMADMTEKVNIWNEEDFPVMDPKSHGQSGSQEDSKSTDPNANDGNGTTETQSKDVTSEEGLQEAGEEERSKTPTNDNEEDEIQQATNDTITEETPTKDIQIDEDDDDLISEIPSSSEELKSYQVVAEIHQERNNDENMEEEDDKHTGKRGNKRTKQKSRKTNETQEDGNAELKSLKELQVWQASLGESSRISVKFKKETVCSSQQSETEGEVEKHSDDEVKDRPEKRSKTE